MLLVLSENVVESIVDPPKMYKDTNDYWTMPVHTSDLVSCWIKRDAAKVRKDGGEQFERVSGGLYGKNGIRGFFEGKECTIQKVKWKVITSLGFWCKEQDIEEEFHLVDFVGSLYLLLVFSVLVIVSWRWPA